MFSIGVARTAMANGIGIEAWLKLADGALPAEQPSAVKQVRLEYLDRGHTAVLEPPTQTRMGLSPVGKGPTFDPTAMGTPAASCLRNSAA